MINVFEPVIGVEEMEAVLGALKRGEISGTHGEAIEVFEQEFAAYCGCKYGVAVNSGTSALHLAVRVAGIGSGDEVLVSASTNIATALAAYHNQAVAVAVDSEDVTWNLDLDKIESLITERTKAIIPVHLYGHPVDMDRLCHIAKQHGITVIEDCAEAHGAKCRGRRVGSFGEMGCFSFYANKIITTGEGGMVITNNEEYARSLRRLRNLSFTEPRFWHEEAGYNYRMMGYQAAMGVVQTRKIDRIILEKRRVAHMYNKYLADIEGIQLPRELEWAINVYWMYAIVVEDIFGVSRNGLMKSLKQKGIDTRTFFCPMNQQPFLRRQSGYRDVSCPVADNIWLRGMYLPSSPQLSESEIAAISNCIRQARNAIGGRP